VLHFRDSFSFEFLVPDEERCAEGSTRVPCSGLDKDVVEEAGFEYFPICYAIESYAAGQAEVIGRVKFLCVLHELEHHFVREFLEGAGDVLVELCERGFWLPRGFPEEFLHFLPCHREPVLVGKVFHVEGETPVFFYINEAAHLVSVPRLSVWGETHHLVFGAIYLEAEVVGEGRVEEAERIGEADFLREAELRSFPIPDGCRRPFTHPVDRDDRGIWEARAEVRRGGMGFVVFGEEERPLILQFFADDVGNPELLRHPLLHRTVVGEETSRPDLEVCPEDALELEERLLVEDDCREILGRYPRKFQGVIDRVFGECFVVLLPRVALLLRCEEYFPVLQETCGAVVIEAGDAEDVGGGWHSAVCHGERRRTMGHWFHTLKLVLQSSFKFLRRYLPAGCFRRRFPYEVNDGENYGVGTEACDPEERQDDLAHDHAQHVAEGHPACVEPGERRGEMHI